MIETNANDPERVDAGDVDAAEVGDQPRSGPRVLGAGRALFGAWSVPDSFFNPLPDELLADFEG